MNTVIPTPEIGSPSHDLLSSAYKPDPPHNWEQGVAFTKEDIAGTPSSGQVVLEGVTAKSAAHAITDNGEEYLPFLIEVGVDRPVASFTASEREDIARRAMERGQRRIIEERMAYGSVGTNQHLNDANVTTVTGTYTPAEALGAIQDGFAGAGGMGTIYVSPMVASSLEEHLTERDGKLYTRVRGDLVIVGNFGAVGPSDAAAAAGTSWVTGHLGIPTLLLGEVQVYSYIEHTTNQPHLRVERVAAVLWNPGQWATLASIDSDFTET